MPPPDLAGLAETLVRDAADAIVYADADGKIRMWNRGAERIFGFTQAEALGQSLDIIIPANLRERHWQGYRGTMQSGRSRYGAGDILAVPAVTKTGVRVSIEFTILPLRDADGRLQGIAAILRDVTRRFEEVRALRKEIGELRAAAGKRG